MDDWMTTFTLETVVGPKEYPITVAVAEQIDGDLTGLRLWNELVSAVRTQKRNGKRTHAYIMAEGSYRTAARVLSNSFGKAVTFYEMDAYATAERTTG